MILPLDDNTVNTVSHLIQLSVAPVFLFAGVGSILAVFSSRLSRIIDKVEKLNHELSQKTSGLEKRSDEIRLQRSYLEKRARNMNRAIFFCTTTGVLVAMVIMIMFLSAFFAFDGSILIAMLFIAAMACFIVALILFLREIFMATYYLKNLRFR